VGKIIDVMPNEVVEKPVFREVAILRKAAELLLTSF